MRVLLAVAPGRGHLAVLAPLARELAARDHEVRMATSRSFCAAVVEAGLRPVPAGMDWLESDLDRFFPQLASLDPVRKSAALGRVFAYFAPRTMVPDLRALVGAWRPEVVVVEPGAAAGRLVAELHDLPCAVVCGTIPTPGLAVALPAGEAGLLAMREALVGPHSRASLRRELGLPADEPEPALFLDMVPPSLHLLTARHLRRFAHPMRPGAYDPPPPGTEDWSWLESLPADRPTVHLSLGTVFHRVPAVLRAAVEGLARLRGSLVVALGDLAAAELGPVPPDVRLVRWAPHDRLLPRCDLFVTHGGISSVMKSLACGVPMLVLPQGGDQHVNALRLRSTGAGRFLEAGQVTAEAVAREARRLLEHPVHRLSAERLREEIEAMPPLEHGVDLVERLARDGQPVEAGAAPPVLL